MTARAKLSGPAHCSQAREFFFQVCIPCKADSEARQWQYNLRNFKLSFSAAIGHDSEGTKPVTAQVVGACGEILKGIPRFDCNFSERLEDGSNEHGHDYDFGVLPRAPL